MVEPFVDAEIDAAPMIVLVTGGSGFVGSQLVAVLSRQLHVTVRAPVRVLRGGILSRAPRVDFSELPSIDEHTDWSPLLGGVSVVIHAAARVHVMHESAEGALDRFRETNLKGTLQLARSAAFAGVKRFVFLSSIKVNGEATFPGEAFTAEDPAAPVDAYGISKAEAEAALQQLATDTGMEVVIIRPVLVYGPGVKGNFSNMMKWVSRRYPLPLASINNSRSLVSVYNLVDFIWVCARQAAAANQIFLVSDGADLSTPQLLDRVARALGVRARLFSVPPTFLSYLARLMGKGAQAQRLMGSLQVDITKNATLLGWVPSMSADEAIDHTARHFKKGTHQ